MSVGWHFWHACSRSSTGHARGLRGVASTLIASALGGITCHCAAGCLGGARYSRLAGGILVIWPAVATANGGASRSWIMHLAVNTIVLVVLVSCGKTARSAQGPELGVTVLLVLTRPETPLARTGRIVVGWRRAIALLTLVGAGECDLKGSRDEKEKAGADSLAGGFGWRAGENWSLHSRIDDGDDECGSLQLAGLMLAITDGRTIDPSASLGTTTGQDGDGNKAPAEADVENYGDESEDGNATEETGQRHGERGVNDSSTLFIVVPISTIRLYGG